MNDYWDYLEHGLKGEERKGHKYYARVRKAKRNLKNAAKKGKAKVASLLREAANKIDS